MVQESEQKRKHLEAMQKLSWQLWMNPIHKCRIFMVLSEDPHYRQAYNFESAVNMGETEVSAGKLEIPMCFEMLYDGNIWIGDSGISSHSTNNKTSAVNEQLFGSASLGHNLKAMNATCNIDMSGRFVT